MQIEQVEGHDLDVHEADPSEENCHDDGQRQQEEFEVAGEFVGDKGHDESRHDSGATVGQAEISGSVLSQTEAGKDRVELSPVGGEATGANAVRQRDQPEVGNFHDRDQTLEERWRGLIEETVRL